MEIRKILALRGPNIWSRHPVLEAWVDLQALKDSPSNTLPGFNERLMAWLPTMIEHRCSIGERGGFFQRLRDGTWPGHILEHVTLELQTLAGTPVGFGKARETYEEGVYRVVVRYKDEQVARACLLAARELVLAAIHDRPFDVRGEVRLLRALVDRVCLGPSTGAIVDAAEARGIPARRLNDGSLVQLGYGSRQHRIWTAETDRTSAVAESIAHDKELTKTLLQSAGVPVPEGRLVEDAEDAWAAACDIGGPVVVKPRDANHARGVFTNLTTQVQVESAFESARREGSGVIVERFAPGAEHRLLVVGRRVVAAVRGDLAQVVGDGRGTIAELIDHQLNSDPRRGEDESFPLSPIEMDAVTLMQLERQGYGPESVPPQGVTVVIQPNDNLSIDVTDQVHPAVAAQAVLAVQVVGLDVAGLDLVVQDISRPLEEQGGVVVEVNAGPGLAMHLKPSVGQPRPVGEAILDTLFPDDDDGRIPIACVTGTNGKTTVTRLLAHMLRATGRVVGMTSSDGIEVGGRRFEGGDCSGPRSARKILMHPHVEVAVFEAGRGGILREGLGFDRCDVAVVTGIGEPDHLGRSNVMTPEDMFTVKRTPVDVVRPSGTAVLNAADELVAGMAPLSAGAVTYFAADGTLPRIVEHRARGLRAVFVCDGVLCCASGAATTPLLPLAEIPMAHGGRVAFQVDNALAAVAAGWSLGLSFELMAGALRSFQNDAADNPGRFNLSDLDGVRLVLDDCHNAAALSAAIAALDAVAPGVRRTAVYSAGHGRRDVDIVRQGELLAGGFDNVVIYEDPTAHDRTPGELTSLFEQGLSRTGAARHRSTQIRFVGDFRQAVEVALNLANKDELVLVQAPDGDLDPALDFSRERGLTRAGQSGRLPSQDLRPSDATQSRQAS